MIRKARLPHRRCPFFVETFAFLSNMSAYYGIFDAQGRGVKGEVGFASDCIYSPNSYPLERTSEQMNSVEAREESRDALRIIHGIRKATNGEFCIGIKMNSVDASTWDSVSGILEQIMLIAEAGIDFIEI